MTVKIMKWGMKVKLLYCPKCNDIKKLSFVERHCKCGHVWGHYEPDGLHAVVSAEAEVLGIDNESLALALGSVLFSVGSGITAWVIPHSSDRVKWEENDAQ